MRDDDHAVRLGHRDALVRALDTIAAPGAALYGSVLTLTATTLSLYALPH